MSQSRPRLSHRFMEEHNRYRVMHATAKGVAEKGYHATSVAHLVKAAGMARNTFYETFSGKEEAFVATVEWTIQEALQRVQEAAGAAPDGSTREQRSLAGLAALLEFIDQQTDRARVCLIYAPAAAPAAYEGMLESFAVLTGMGEPKAQLVVGGIVWMLYRDLVTPARNPDLPAEIQRWLEMQLTPVPA